MTENSPAPYHMTADDWGLTPAVNQGILKLAQKERLDRVSILVDGPFAALYLDELTALPKIKIGLHFNLTHNSLCASPLKLLIYTLNPFIPKKSKQEKIRSELQRQLNVLQNLGIKPYHMDGHHHCHIFPVVAEEVAPFAFKNNIHHIRLPSHASLWLSTKFLLPLLSLSAKKIFERNKLNFLPFYYPSLALFKNPEKLKRALQDKKGYEIITHPAEKGDLPEHGCKDKYNDERVVEFNALIK